MKRFLSLVLMIVPLSGGCTHQMWATWRTTKVEPADGAQSFEIRSITLNKDGTYVALAGTDEELRKVVGRWKYDGMRLSLVGADGETRVCDARVWWNTELRLMMPGSDGRATAVTMVKVECEGKCAAGTCAKCDKRPRTR